jgi:hypothetical protein
MAKIEEKLYSDQPPVEKVYTHDWVSAKVDEFLRCGGKVEVLPAATFSRELEPDSATRQKIEKEKNFGSF